MIVKESNQRQFIHYGADFFNTEKFQPIKNRTYMAKPEGGLWACSADTTFGWKEYCLSEGLHPSSSDRLTKFFWFTFKEDTKILHLEDPEDFDFLPIKWSAFHAEKKENPYVREDIDKFCYTDWEALASIGIDAVEYIRTPYGHDVFYSWDFDSIVVLNPDCIQEY